MSRAGFSLIELIVTMAIIGILLSVATLNFTAMQRKARIESETRQIFADLNDARLNAIYLKRNYRVTFQPGSYVMKNYTSDNEATTAGKTLFTKTVPYQLSLSNGGSIANAVAEFDKRGLATDQTTLNIFYVNPAKSGAIIDCIVIGVAKTNMGQGVDSDNNGQAESCSVK
ncbi:Tfp pilus assembly protein FimT/FimU [Geobacter sp. FeAm09]|uniref:pilus assembly FimT family protein n=1 Tax=Geobacter sp. FeAm09 TaxID=2597769 RepID=UPI00143D1656|nr:type II secretion system protein [Geobacter sp. FeAm09]